MPNCSGPGIAFCGACQDEWYCGAECQRADWKVHKITCGKKLMSKEEIDYYSDYQASKADVAMRFGTASERVRAISLLEKSIMYAKRQYGDRVPGEYLCRRKDGTMIKDWPLFTLREALVGFYISQNTDASLDIALARAKETRAELETLRSNPEDQKEFYQFLWVTETQMGEIYDKKLQAKEALHHTKEALVAARQGKPECSGEYSENLLLALTNLADMHSKLKTGEGEKIAEEAYTLVSEHHGPEHPDVLDTATYLITMYQDSGKYVDAERFARINYESLTDPGNKINRSGETFAVGKMQLARSWLHAPSSHRVGGIEAGEEAEMLAREACQILENTAVRCNGLLSSTYSTFAEIMLERGNITVEIENTLLKALALKDDTHGVGEGGRGGGGGGRYGVARGGGREELGAEFHQSHHLNTLGKYYTLSVAAMSGRERDREIVKAEANYRVLLIAHNRRLQLGG